VPLYVRYPGRVPFLVGVILCRDLTSKAKLGRTTFCE
jgi:hypothetical protein